MWSPGKQNTEAGTSRIPVVFVPDLLRVPDALPRLALGKCPSSRHVRHAARNHERCGGRSQELASLQFGPSVRGLSFRKWKARCMGCSWHVRGAECGTKTPPSACCSGFHVRGLCDVVRRRARTRFSQPAVSCVPRTPRSRFPLWHIVPLGAPGHDHARDGCRRVRPRRTGAGDI